MEERWLTLSEAAEIMGVGKKTVSNWLRSDNPPPVHARVGARLRFLESELVRWMRESAPKGCRGHKS